MRTHTVVLLAVLGSAVPVLAQGATLSFSDQTAAAGISVKYLPGSFTDSGYIAPGACGDFDKDGFQDLFFPSGGGSNGPDRLYINQGDGTFLDEAASWGLTTVHRGLGVAVGDFDGDGFVDLFEASAGVSGSGQSGQNKLYHNLGGQGFQDVAAAAGVTGVAGDSFGASFGDFDLDGDLDLFVTGFNSHLNRLYRNNGNGTFSDATSSSQLIGSIANVYGLATHFVDMNGDRYPELLISGDFGSSRFFRNNGNGTFTNYTFQSGTGKDENGMGGTVGDFNRDGLLDWYVTSIYKTDPTPPWTGNKLYQRDGALHFSEISGPAGVWDGGYGWGTVAIDFDHDGWQDIAETNGAQWSAEWVNERSYLWLNQGNDTFVESSQASNLNDFGQGRGMLAFDYDNDGDEDLVIVRNDDFARLWRNDLQGSDIHWLRILLDTSADKTLAPDGYGSIVRVTAGGVQQTGIVGHGDNLQSQSELTAHFGLGAETVVSEVAVHWNDGRVTQLTNVPVDQSLTIAIQPVWTNAGSGLAGFSGTPILVGSGPLTTGSSGSLALTSARPSSLAILFVSLFNSPTPFKGGFLVPVPVVTQLTLSTNAVGSITLAWPAWQAGLSGFSVYFQYAIADAAAVAGASLSNALKAAVP